MTIDEKRALIDSDNKSISISKQCELLELSRSSYYYKQKQYTDEELLIMNLIDRIHTSQPTYGSRRITAEINTHLREYKMKTINRKRTQRLMQIMGIETIYQKPNLSKLLHKEYIGTILIKKHQNNTS